MHQNHRGAYSAPHTTSWWGRGSLVPPQEPHPRSRPFSRDSRINASMYTIIKTTSVGDARLSMVGVAGRLVILTGWPVTVGVVETRLAAATLSGRGARVYTCTCVHVNILCRRLPK